MSVFRPASALMLSVVLTALGPIAAVDAQGTSSAAAPPGNSAVDQYRESLPPSSSERRTLSRRDREQLERRGTDGKALAAVLERSGGVPREAPSAGGGEPSAAGGKPSSASERRSRKASGAAARRTDTRSTTTDEAGSGGERPSTADAQPIAPAAASSTVGPVPVWVLLVAAAALVGVGLVVRRRAAS